MRVLLGCERSGVIRRAMGKRGYFAVSVDLKPAADWCGYDGSHDEYGGEHWQGDIIDFIYHNASGHMDIGFDLGIFHPECTFLTNSAEWAYGDGPYHQKLKPDTLVGDARRKARDQAVQFVFKLWEAPIKRICIENPRGHLSRHKDRLGVPQYIQPWQFGDDASKATGLWLKNLPQLQPTKFVSPRYVCQDCKHTTLGTAGDCPRCGSLRVKERWANQTDTGQNRLSPSDDRAEKRAQTYPGIAAAFADQFTRL